MNDKRGAAGAPGGGPAAPQPGTRDTFLGLLMPVDEYKV